MNLELEPSIRIYDIATAMFKDHPRVFRNYSDESRAICDPVVFVSRFTEKIRINLLKVALELFQMSNRERAMVKFDMGSFASCPGYSLGRLQPFEVISTSVASFMLSLHSEDAKDLEYCGTSCCACGIAAIIGVFDEGDYRGWSHAVKEHLLPVSDDNLWNFFFGYLFAQYWKSDLLATAKRIAHFALTMSLLENVIPDNNEKIWHRTIQYSSSIPYLRGLDVDWALVRAIIDVGFIDVTEVEIQEAIDRSLQEAASVTEPKKTTFPASEQTPSANV